MRSPSSPTMPSLLSDGDQIHIGGWTTLTMERLDPSSVARFEAESRPSKDTRNLARGRRPWEVGLLGPLRLVVSGQEVPITARQDPRRTGLARPPGRSTDIGAGSRVGALGRRRAQDRRDGAAGGTSPACESCCPSAPSRRHRRGPIASSDPSTPSTCSGSSVSARSGIQSCSPVTPARPPPSSAGRSSSGGVSHCSTWATGRPGGRPRWCGSWSAGRPPRRISSRPASSSGDHQNLRGGPVGRPWKQSRCASVAGPS